MGYETRLVKVSDIAEYPTELGSRCKLLEYFGLSAYWDSGEAIAEALLAGAQDPGLLDLCKNACRCKAFWGEYQKGATPYYDDDPIKLEEFEGKHWAKEGKHRVCMAMRSGVEFIKARVTKLDSDQLTLLPHYGDTGSFTFRFRYSRRRRTGETPVLWVDIPRGADTVDFGFVPVILNEAFDTGGETIEVFEGVSYSVDCKPHKLFGLSLGTAVMVRVDINPNHLNTRIWLLQDHADELKVFREPPVNTLKTVYRYGLWRTRNLEEHTSNKRMLSVRGYSK